MTGPSRSQVWVTYIDGTTDEPIEGKPEVIDGVLYVRRPGYGRCFPLRNIQCWTVEYEPVISRSM